MHAHAFGAIEHVAALTDRCARKQSMTRTSASTQVGTRETFARDARSGRERGRLLVDTPGDAIQTR
ncbi:hypothetical protein [Burkholderia diffusa]|uniref:hypothetical protein n=1 Tax=Burkholderia TaxID=32008 RepID=UPI0012469037|nr:hypothetical protein [Burkholderia diffusa]KAB0650177.1 hypothetical protein F7R23_24900 [Burkholderia diffusa]MBM2656901.1 hypothetical protein [Burkholderia diffusa]